STTRPLTFASLFRSASADIFRLAVRSSERSVSTDAQSMPKPGQSPKRRIRNFLLDARFQLKYTGAVVAVTVIVTGLVGFWLGRRSEEHTSELQSREN